jgi:ribosomal protein L17
MKHTHILVIRFSALGDVAMMVPIVWALARQYPDVRITVLSRPVARPLFDDIAPKYVGRTGGYTRIIRLGARRGDGSEMAILEFV